jgi:phytol kinase
MIAVLVGLILLFSIVLLVELLHSRGHISTEMARKTIHLATGLLLVAWSFLVSWHSIVYAEIFLIGAVSATRWLKLFNSQNGVNRITWGEFFFPIGVILAILLKAPRWVFILAILHLAVADAAAALVGKKYGQSTSYKVFGHKKSLVGSAAFFIVSIVLVSATLVIAPAKFSAMNKVSLLLLPIITTFAENFGVYGSDNLLVPLVIVFLLS